MQCGRIFYVEEYFNRLNSSYVISKKENIFVQSFTNIVCFKLFVLSVGIYLGCAQGLFLVLCSEIAPNGHWREHMGCWAQTKMDVWEASTLSSVLLPVTKNQSYFIFQSAYFCGIKSRHPPFVFHFFMIHLLMKNSIQNLKSSNCVPNKFD